MNEKKDTDSDLETLYQDYWSIHSSMLDKGHAPVEIASILIAQGLSIYRTILDHDDYYKMVDDIGRLRDQVQILSPEQGHYH